MTDIKVIYLLWEGLQTYITKIPRPINTKTELRNSDHKKSNKSPWHFYLGWQSYSMTSSLTCSSLSYFQLLSLGCGLFVCLFASL